MKFNMLRCYMGNRRNVPKDYILKDCSLVIDGDSFFRKTYSDSGCKFILGGDFDRYADYLKRILTGFIESKVTCYVIFKGTANEDIDRRKEIHQKLINDKITMLPGDDKYYVPIFLKDVDKQVLDDLNISYCVCEHDARETLLDVSKEYKCPVLTHNIEYCLLGMECITPNTLVYNCKKKQVAGKIHTPQGYKGYIPVFDNMKPIFMAVLDEDGPLYGKIPEIVGAKPSNPVGPVLCWTKRQKREEAIDKLAKILDSDTDRQLFRKSVDDTRKIIFYKRNNEALNYFKSVNKSIDSSDNDWFKKGVMSGKVARPYVNLKKNGIISGSWVICEKIKDDAMLPSLDIITYANGILTNSKKSVFTFINRNEDQSCHSKIMKNLRGVFPDTEDKDKKCATKFRTSDELFSIFIESALPGFEWSLLQTVPKDCWLIIITLVYYISKSNREFITVVDSILLSYVTLGPVSEKVGLIKRSNLTMCHDLTSKDNNDQSEYCTYNDCLTAAHAAIDYFYEGDIKKTFDRSVLHDLAEYQHCLQHMNYLNKLCGEHIQCTNYYKSYNGTFIFNVLLRMREDDNAMLFFQSHFKNSVSVLKFFKHVKEVFEKCLSSIKL